MKKTAIISKQNGSTDKEQLFARGNNLILSQSSSVIDLPRQIGNVLINNDKITFKAISWCMFPVIWAGDIIKIKPIKPEDTDIGDIVLYKFVGRAFAHRLVKRYREQGKLYIVTSGEKEYRDNHFSDHSGIPADNILGKVIEVKRGKLYLKPDEVKLSLGCLIKGRLKLSLWTLIQGIKQYIAKIFIKLQGVKLYRYFFRRLIKDKVSFFVGTPIIKNVKEINNFCFYQRFSDFSKDFGDIRGLYNLSARINNKSVSNISLLLEKINNSKICTLSNFIVRIPYRGGGVGYQLAKKAIRLCSKLEVDEMRIALSEGDKIAIELFKKLGFGISQ